MALEMQKVKPSAIICHAHDNFTTESIYYALFSMFNFSSTICLHMLVHT